MRKVRNKVTQREKDKNISFSTAPISHGFDYYFGTGTINFPPYTWIENDKVLELPVEILDLKDLKTAEGRWECRPGPAARNWNMKKVPMLLLEKAVEWIKSHREDPKPFFLYYALPSPHAPIIPDKEFQGKSGACGFGDYVVETDWMVGKILEALIIVKYPGQVPEG